jgi:hypothetical protein
VRRNEWRRCRGLYLSSYSRGINEIFLPSCLELLQSSSTLRSIVCKLCYFQVSVRCRLRLVPGKYICSEMVWSASQFLGLHHVHTDTCPQRLWIQIGIDRSRFPYAYTLDSAEEVLMVKTILTVRPKPKTPNAFRIDDIADPEHSIVTAPFLWFEYGSMASRSEFFLLLR